MAKSVTFATNPIRKARDVLSDYVYEVAMAEENLEIFVRDLAKSLGLCRAQVYRLIDERKKRDGTTG